MNLKKLAVVGGVALGLAVPTGVAVAATTGPSPAQSPSISQSTPTTPGGGYGYGPGYGMGGYGVGDPEDCPFYDDRPAATNSPTPDGTGQQLREQHREFMGQMMGGPRS